MRIVRTYPPLNPEILRGRARVEDELPRCYIREYDNRPLADFRDDIILLEWDIAMSREDLVTFWEIAEGYEDVMAVPYRLYEGLPSGVWSPRVVVNSSTVEGRWVTTGDLTADLVGFGATYLPRDLIAGFMDDRNYHTTDSRMTDTNFSIWHYRTIRKKIPLLWALKAVHLHYELPKEWNNGTRSHS